MIHKCIICEQLNELQPRRAASGGQLPVADLPWIVIVLQENIDAKCNGME